MKRLGIGLGILVAILAVVWWMIGSDWRRLILAAPSDANVLFWTQDQRDAGFRMLDRVSFLVAARDIPASDTVKALPEGAPLNLDLDLEAYMPRATYFIRTESLMMNWLKAFGTGVTIDARSIGTTL